MKNKPIFLDEFTKQGSGVGRAMLELMLPETQKAKKPAPKWRNTWRCTTKTGKIRLLETGEIFDVGTGNIFISPRLWPTKEIAEHEALKRIKSAINPSPYLGPIPCDENGNPI